MSRKERKRRRELMKVKEWNRTVRKAMETAEKTEKVSIKDLEKKLDELTERMLRLLDKVKGRQNGVDNSEIA